MRPVSSTSGSPATEAMRCSPPRPITEIHVFSSTAAYEINSRRNCAVPNALKICERCASTETRLLSRSLKARTMLAAPHARRKQAGIKCADFSVDAMDRDTCSVAWSDVQQPFFNCG